MLLSPAHVPCIPTGPTFIFPPVGLNPADQPLFDCMFNPPGVSAHDKDPDEDLPFDPTDYFDD